MSRQNPSEQPASRPAGIREVARLAGVSIATVSRALNDPASVSSDTLARILSYTQALDYQPSSLGRNLVRGRSFLVGVIIPDAGFPLYGEMLHGIEDLLSQHGMSALLACSHDDAETERACALKLTRHAIDGGIVVASLLGETLLSPARQGWIYVSPEGISQGSQSGGTGAGEPARRVELDNRAGGRLAAEELLRCGRRLAYLGAPGRESLEREQGFAETLKAVGLDYQRFEGDYSEASGGAAGVQMAACAPPDAVFVAGDLMAAGLMRALTQAGLRVPHDVALVGFDDTQLASLLSPRLSSVRQPAYQMGRAAAELSLRLIDGKDVQPVVFPPELIRRETSAGPDRVT